MYGFDSEPGRLPTVLNLVRNGIRLKLRGPSPRPSFTGLDAVLLPFDPYAPWRGGDDGHVAALELAAAVEVRRAVAAGVAVVFVLMADGSPAPAGLGALMLADLGLRAVPLPEPEERLAADTPAFAAYLRRFAVGGAAFEGGPGGSRMAPLCRAADGRPAGVVVGQGRGGVFFVPGPTWRRPLGFYLALAAAVAAFRGQVQAAGPLRPPAGHGG